MTSRDREFLSAVCAERAGLRIEAGRAYLMESALAPVARREGYGEVGEMVRAARDRGEERLIGAMVEALAPAQTAFFRDPEVFEAVAETVSHGPPGEPMRIWFAGCGPGQEAYSLAMLLDERGLAGRAEIFASDLSARALEKAQSGIYGPLEVQRGLSADRLVRHFENCGEDFAISGALRRRVRWWRVNLIEDLSRLGLYDVVLCRYVLGSMVRSARLRALAGLAGALAPGGSLVLSPGDVIAAESLGLQPIAGAPGAWRYPEPPAAAAA